MKKLFLIFVLAIIITGCKKDSVEGKNSIKNETKDEKFTTSHDLDFSKYRVTFIELGSVNCIPCKMMQPVMEKIQRNYKDVNVVFYDVWTERDNIMAYKYGIRVIPTQIFIDRNGKEFFRHEGYFPYEEVERILRLPDLK